MRIYKIYIFLILLHLTACSKPQVPIAIKREDYAWQLVETFYQTQILKDDIQQKFGDPKEIEKDGTLESWRYDKKEGYPEWFFIFNQKNNLTSIHYIPNQTISVSELEKKWEKEVCEHKKEQKLFPDFIQTKMFLICNYGKRKIEYNRYNEVLSISLEK
jgi:hypothetical protein